MAKITLEELMDIAFAHEEGDPIDWGVFKEGQEQAMRMIGTSILINSIKMKSQMQID